MGAGARRGWLRRRMARLRLFGPPFGEAAARRPEMVRLPANTAQPPAAPLDIWVTTTPEDLRAVRTLVHSIDQCARRVGR